MGRWHRGDDLCTRIQIFFYIKKEILPLIVRPTWYQLIFLFLLLLLLLTLSSFPSSRHFPSSLFSSYSFSPLSSISDIPPLTPVTPDIQVFPSPLSHLLHPVTSRYTLSQLSYTLLHPVTPCFTLCL